MKIAIIGGPRCGKSTLATNLAQASGSPIYCSDHLKHVRQPNLHATYMPADVPWELRGTWIAENWLNLPSPWIIEGCCVVHALRHYLKEHHTPAPCDKIILLTRPYLPLARQGQRSLLKAVRTIWHQISAHYQSANIPIENVSQLSVSNKTTKP